MIVGWSGWRILPDPQSGGHIDAPVGPGLYDVCAVATGESVAFGYASSVAQALARVASASERRWPWFHRARPRYRAGELEYRVCATGTVETARIAADQLVNYRQALRRRFMPAISQ